MSSELVKQQLLPSDVKRAMQQYMRSGRFGTCSGCPRTLDGEIYPEFCEFTERYDHQLGLKNLIERLQFLVTHKGML